MNKNIAIVAGGDQSEVVVSLRSAEGIYSFIDKSKYNVYVVTIVGQNWKVRTDNGEIDIDKNDFSFVSGETKTKFDFAYVTIHGTPGEDGKLQGYFDLIGMPYSCCGVLASAITYNKYTCNTYLKNFNIPVAPSCRLRKGEKADLDSIEKVVGYPCFVKPSDGGSSFGVTKVKEQSVIQKAIDKAFAEGSEVVIEKFMDGTEITCGIFRGKNGLTVLPITEVVSQNEFFDYDAKYNGQVSEITPARIPEHIADVVRSQTKKIYEILGAKGIIRVDYIITGETVNLLEVNTTPGMTATSFIPQQVKAADLDIKDVMSDIIETNC